MLKLKLPQRTIAALLLASCSFVFAGESPDQPQLTAEFVYKYLVAEIAGQRGEIGLASSLLYELAKSTRNAELAERAARAAAFGNQISLAVRAATLWAELDPASNEAHQAIAQMLLGTGKLADAKPHLQKLLEVEESRGNGFLYLNGILARHGDKAAVLKLIQQLAKPYPDLAEARFAVAHSAWNAGNAELALKELQAADELRPGWELPALLHGEILLRKSPEQALAFYRNFLEQYANANDVRLTYARLLVNLKQLEAARTQFSLLMNAAETNPEVPVVVGLLAVQLGDFSAADAYFQKALERGYRDRDQIYLYLGQSAEKQKKDDQAIAWFKRVGEGEHRLDAQLRIAGVMARQEGLDQARRYLQTLPELTSEQQVLVQQYEASLLMQAKRPAEAFALLEHTVNTLPNTPELIYDYAMAAEKLQRFDVMEQQLRKLIMLKPDYAQAYNALGYSLADRNERLPEASKLLEQALSLSPNDYYILDSMGWLQYRLGKLEKALEYLQRAYRIQNDPEIAAHLGEVLWKKGRRDEAIKTWEEALREFPDNEALRNTYQKFQP